MGIAREKGSWDIKLMGSTIYGGFISRTIKVIIDGNLGPPEFKLEEEFLSFTIILKKKVDVYEEHFPKIIDPDSDDRVYPKVNFKKATAFSTYK